MGNKFNNKPNECIVQNGKEYWISRSCAVVGLVTTIDNNNTEYILIVKRGSNGDNVGKYCLPCGYIDWNECGYDAFKREIFEETGIDLDQHCNNLNEKSLMNQKQPFYVSTTPKNNRENISLYFRFEIEFGDNLPETTNKFSEPNEIDEIIWMPISGVDRYDFCFGHDEIIKTFC